GIGGPSGELLGLLELPGRQHALVIFGSIELEGLAAAREREPGDLITEAVGRQLAHEIGEFPFLGLLQHVRGHCQANGLAAGLTADINDILVAPAEGQLHGRLLVFELGFGVRIFLLFLLCFGLAVFLVILGLGVFLLILLFVLGLFVLLFLLGFF